jgi:hypothetical protein
MPKYFTQPGETVIGGLDSNDTPKHAKIDSATHTMQSIDYAHHEIHAGSHFMYSDSVELDTGILQDYLIVTPDTTAWAHMLLDLDASATAKFDLYEDSTHTSTDAQTVFNNNRNSTDTAGVTIYKATTTDAADGSLLMTFKGGSATNQSKSPTSARNDTEIILKQDSTYMVRLTSFADNNLCNLRLEWYEHTNKG